MSQLPMTSIVPAKARSGGKPLYPIGRGKAAPKHYPLINNRLQGLLFLGLTTSFSVNFAFFSVTSPHYICSAENKPVSLFAKRTVTESGEAMPAMSHWSVVRTRPRWEKKVTALLAQKGIETFCPVQKARSQWSDRVKTIEKPLLKSFVFVKISEDQRTVVRLTEGVVNFVYRDGKPMVIKEKLIQSIRQFQQAHTEVSVMESPFGAGMQERNSAAQVGKNKAATLRIDTLDLLLVGGPVQANTVSVATDKI